MKTTLHPVIPFGKANINWLLSNYSSSLNNYTNLCHYNLTSQPTKTAIRFSEKRKLKGHFEYTNYSMSVSNISGTLFADNEAFIRKQAFKRYSTDDPQKSNKILI